MFNSRLLAAACAAAALFALGACGDSKDDNKKPTQPECVSNDDCRDGFVCSSAGTCVPETTGCNPACGEGEVCDTATNTCKPATEPTCTENADCGEGQVCDTSVEGGACVGCLTDSDCNQGELCDAGSKSCVAAPECENNDDCDGGVCAANHCVTCTADEGCGAGQVCDTTVAGGACVECLGNADCGGETPVCSNQVCVGCTATQGCGEGEVCDLETATCVPDIECTSNSDCGDASRPYCVENFCVACVSGSDCGGTTPVCDAGTNACVGCSDDAECPASEPVCLSTGACATRIDATIAQLEQVRGTADGSVFPALPIENALVTYVKPTLGTEAGGFFVQAQPAGPAIFVESTETVSVGDEVSFDVTGVGTVSNSVRKVAALENLQVVSTGNAVAPFVQNVSGASDLVSNLMAYESELVSATGTISGAFANGGATHRSAQFDTAAITGDANLKLRIAPSLESDLDLLQGCALTVTGPVWRFGAQVQLLAYSANDLTNVSCPAPVVVSAVATSSTEVVVTFSRHIAETSVLANGSQFTFDNGLTASAAVVDGKSVRVSTSGQAAGTTYTVTVGSGITDAFGTALASTSATATFPGYMASATLLINEINQGISSARDLVELLVTNGGSLAGMKLVTNPTPANPTGLVQIAFPSVTVATGDLIVVHFSPNASETAETVSKNEVSASTYYANAWDFPAASAADIKNSSAVVAVVGAAGEYMDVVALANSNSPPADFGTSLNMMQAAGLWLPADCNGVACNSTTGRTVSVDWGSVGTNATKSVQRYAGANTHQKADWSAAVTSTFGAPNTVAPPAP